MPRLGQTGPSTLNPKDTTSRVDSQQFITVQAANKYNVSPQTLWGIYGTESSFGADSSNSSTGAQGPMQFEPGTWAKYGGGRSVQAFDAAMPAAAKYLHDLGANSNPTSPQTIAAINAYNGNGGGSNPATAYAVSVVKLGSQLSVSGVSATTTDSTSSVGGSSGGGGGGSLLDVLSDIVTGDISDLAATVALAAAEGIKDLAVGFADLVIVPLWHRNQQAVWWYSTNVLFPTGNSSPYKVWKTYPVNAAFWGFGYGLLFTDPESGSLRPASPRRSRIARHARRLQALPARQALTKPSQVKEKTAKKPKEVQSKVAVSHVGTLATLRNRPVRITGSVNNGRQGPELRPGESETTVRQAGTIQPPKTSGEPFKVSEAAQSHTDNSGRRPTHASGRNAPSRNKGAGRRRRS